MNSVYQYLNGNVTIPFIPLAFISYGRLTFNCFLHFNSLIDYLDSNSSISSLRLPIESDCLLTFAPQPLSPQHSDVLQTS